MSKPKIILVVLGVILLILTIYIFTAPSGSEANLDGYRFVSSNYVPSHSFHLTLPFFAWVGPMEVDEWVTLPAGWHFLVGDRVIMGWGKKCAVFALHGPSDRGYIILTSSFFTFISASDRFDDFESSLQYDLNKLREKSSCSDGIDLLEITQ